MYMPPERANRIGLPGTHLLAQSFYDLAIESLHAAELATVNSSMFSLLPTVASNEQRKTEDLHVQSSSRHSSYMYYSPMLPYIWVSDYPIYCFLSFSG